MLQLPVELREVEEGYIRKKVRPNVTDNQLRTSFWLEYNNVQHNFLPRMIIGNILRGICSDTFFYNQYISNQERLAFLVTPPVFYMARLEHLMKLATERMEEILEASPMDKEGKIDTKVSNLQMKIYMMLDMRARGSYTQRLEVNGRSVNLDVKASTKEIVQLTENMNMEEIEKRLEKLKRLESKTVAVEAPLYVEEKKDIETTSVEISSEKLLDKPVEEIF